MDKKKPKTLYFILIATGFNIMVTLVCFTAISLIHLFILRPYLPEKIRSWSIPLIFAVALVFSTLIYHIVFKRLIKRITKSLLPPYPVE